MATKLNPYVNVPDGQARAAPPWGDKFGSFKDRFGINWIINIAGPATYQSKRASKRLFRALFDWYVAGMRALPRCHKQV